MSQSPEGVSRSRRDAGDLRVREDRAVELRGFLGFLVEPEMRCDWFHRPLPRCPTVQSRHPAAATALAEQRIEQLIALLHAVGHAGRHRRVPRLLRPEVHQRGHRRDAAVLRERHRHERFALGVCVADGPRIVGLGVHEPRWRLHLAKRAGEAELAGVLVTPPAPPVTAADAHVHLAHRHRPSGRTEKPALHQRRFRVCPVHQRPGRLERSRDLDLAIAGQRDLCLFHRRRHVALLRGIRHVCALPFCPPPRARRRGRPALQLLQNAVEALEVRFPARAIPLEPGTRLGQRLPLESTGPPLGVLANRDQPARAPAPSGAWRSRAG